MTTLIDDILDEEAAPLDAEAIAKLPLNEQVLARIDLAYAQEPQDTPRSYIGASSVGTKCDAEMSFNLRGFPGDTPQPKLKRIFRDGHRIERTVVSDLKKAGYRILEVDETTGRQWRFELAGGHIVCNTDGLIDLEGNEQLDLLEIKSMNDAQWKNFKKKGVRESHPKYWDQMQMMGGMGGYKRCLFISYNKNTSEYWAEIVPLDPMEWNYIQTRIETVWRGEAKKITDDPDSFFCRFCSKSGVCWGSDKPEVACRTCKHAAPISSGEWWCKEFKGVCSTPCPKWEQYRPMDKS